MNRMMGGGWGDIARTALVVAVLAVTGACSTPPPVFGDVSELSEQFGDAVWHVDADGCGWRSRGSAFAVDSRHLVTNYHVVANDSAPIVISRRGETRRGRVIGVAEHPDVAVIRVEDDLPLTLDWAPASALVPQEPLVVMGYPSPSHQFAASMGQIVNFQGGGGVREAALSNAYVERGNSGGPGVRADATVAGVVTLMALKSDSEERVAVLLTADAVRATIAGFVANPREVLSTCGLGPDYVPEVPESYDIPQVPSPPPADVALTPTPTPAPTAEPTPPPPTATSAPTPSPSPVVTPTPTPTPSPSPEPSPTPAESPEPTG